MTETITLARPKPRNPLVAACRQRQAGAHRRSNGGQRQRGKQTLRAELLDHHRQRHSP